jgi:hypothetical protein
MTHERVCRPLGRIAELLIENNAKASLNEIRDLLEALDTPAYRKGFEDGQIATEDRSGRMMVCPTPVEPAGVRLRYQLGHTSSTAELDPLTADRGIEVNENAACGGLLVTS